MEKGFRESMRWLHTWSGLIVGWLLFAIFVTGTSAYYKDEISLWMKPEFHKSKVTEKTMEVAIDLAIANTKKATKVSVTLPSSRSNVIAIKTEGSTSTKSQNNSNEKMNQFSSTNSEKNASNQKTTKSRNTNTYNKNKQTVESLRTKRNESSQRNSEIGKKEPNYSRTKDNTRNEQNIQKNQSLQASSTVKKNASTQKNTKNQGGNRKRRVPPTYYDASTGELINEVTKTGGGNFLYRFHFELYSIPRGIARLIVGIATMIMLVAIISGIITHKRIFKDIFTFRPKNNPRGWLDAHVLPAVAALPFFIMITYSGLLFFSNTMMPWPMQVHYDNFGAYKQDMRGGGNTNNKKENTPATNKAQIGNSNQGSYQNANNAKPLIVKAVRNRQMERLVNNNAKRNISKSDNKNTYRIASSNAKKQIFSHKQNEVKKAEITKENLSKIMQEANVLWPNNVGSFSIVKNEEKNTILVTVGPRDSSSLFNTRQKKSIIYDGTSAKVIKETSPALQSSLILKTSGAFRSLHEAKFADSTIRLLFFICGLCGVIISGTGLILWVEKRKKKNQNTKTFGFWLVQKLNLGTIMGLFIAIAIYFISNRLLSVDESMRKDLEINAFFIAWLLSYVYGFIRNTSKAWRELLLFASILFFTLPILNAITVFDSFYQIFSRDNIFIYFDICMIFMGAVFTLVRFILLKKLKRGEIK